MKAQPRPVSGDAYGLFSAGVAATIVPLIIGIVVASSDRIEAANDAFLTMIGYDRDDLESRTIS